MILRLILGDQLNPKHSWFDSPREDVVYALFESEEELRYAPHHRQKMLAFLHGMQLLDYDPASNWANWAYLAGVGNDARPVRRFNTVKQAQDYDANRAFREAWLQEY